MDQFTIQNTVWFVVLMASVIINWRMGYKRGVVDSYMHTTVPVIEMLVEQGYINVNEKGDGKEQVDIPVLTARLVQLAMLRKAHSER